MNNLRDCGNVLCTDCDLYADLVNIDINDFIWWESFKNYNNIRSKSKYV